MHREVVTVTMVVEVPDGTLAPSENKYCGSFIAGMLQGFSNLKVVSHAHTVQKLDTPEILKDEKSG